MKKKAALNYEGSDETFYDVQKMRTSRWIGATGAERRRDRVSELDACKQWRTDYGVALQVTECLETFKLI